MYKTFFLMLSMVIFSGNGYAQEVETAINGAEQVMENIQINTEISQPAPQKGVVLPGENLQEFLSEEPNLPVEAAEPAPDEVVVFPADSQTQSPVVTDSVSVSVSEQNPAPATVTSDIEVNVEPSAEVKEPKMENLTEKEQQDIKGLVDMMQEVVKVMGPTMIAIDEGKKLPKANEEMANNLKNALDPKYTENAKSEIDDEVNELKLSGEYKVNGTTLKYELNRNLAQTLLIQDMLEGSYPESTLGENAEIENLDNENVPAGKFEVFDVDGVSFAGYDDPENKTIYMLTNIGAYLSLKLQSKGDDYKRVAGEFTYGLDFNALKNAIKDDGRSIEYIRTLVNEQLNDPVKLKELMSQKK